MGTADDPGLLLIGKEVLLPPRALEGESRLKKTSGVSQRSEARGSAVFFCVLTVTAASWKLRMDPRTSICLCKVPSNAVWL